MIMLLKELLGSSLIVDKGEGERKYKDSELTKADSVAVLLKLSYYKLYEYKIGISMFVY